MLIILQKFATFDVTYVCVIDEATYVSSPLAVIVDAFQMFL